MQLYVPAILKSLKENKQENWYYCINQTQWQHNFNEKNYLPLNNNFEHFTNESFNRNSFLKIAKKIPLQQWDDAFNFYDHTFKEILLLLNSK